MGVERPTAVLTPPARGSSAATPGSERARSGEAEARRQRFLATSGLMLATALQAADATIVNVALPRLEHDLGGAELGAWVIASYLCATAVTAPLTGWLRRRTGARRLYWLALGAFTFASLLCASAPTGAMLVAFRIFQGAGAGVLLPLSQAILLELYPKERHGRMLAAWGAALMVGPIVGPPLGGFITDVSSWRGAFLINLLFGGIVVILLRGLRRPEERVPEERLDPVGVVALMVGVGALELCLQRGIGRPWLTSPDLLAEAALAAIALAVMIVRGRRGGMSVVRPDVFKDANFAAAAFYNFMTSGLLFVSVVFIPALGEGPLGYRATLAGLTIVPRAVLMMLLMLFVGRLIGRVDFRILLGSGWVLMAAGLAVLANVRAADGLLWIVVGSTIQAAGAGLLFTPLSTLAFSSLAPELRTDAAGVYSLLRQLGFATGVTVMTAVLRLMLEPQAADLGPTLAAYSRCFGVMAIASLAVIPGIFVFRPPPQPDPRGQKARLAFRKNRHGRARPASTRPSPEAPRSPGQAQR